MAMSKWSLEQLERIANRDVIEDWSTVYELQQLAAELAAEYRELTGLPPAVVEDE
jgi:hypothetical protein